MSSIAEMNRMKRIERRLDALEAMAVLPPTHDLDPGFHPPFEVKRSFGQYTVIDDTDAVVFTAKTKAEAQAKAEGLAV